MTQYLQDLQKVIDELSKEDIQQATDLIFEAWQERKRIFFLGNGGSASTASHIVCDLGKGTIVPGKAHLSVSSLTDNVALLTAWANDSDYANIFAAQLTGQVEPGDVVIGISASGQSPNVLNAMAAARSFGARTIGLTGLEGGKLKGLVDHCLVVPSRAPDQIENAHLIVLHCMFQDLRERISRAG